MSIPLGIRQNNPGNLERTKKGKDPWRGEIARHGRFAHFLDMEWGVRAAAINLISYYRNKKIVPPIRTIRQAVTRWAPHHENPTDRYEENVAEWSGLPVDSPLKLDAAETLVKILPAMFRQENGTNKGKPWVEAATIERGVAMAVKDRP